MRAGMTQSGQGCCRVRRSVPAHECTFPRMVAWEVVSWDPGEYLPPRELLFTRHLVARGARTSVAALSGLLRLVHGV